jgi:hypothetical protein
MALAVAREVSLGRLSPAHRASRVRKSCALAGFDSRGAPACCLLATATPLRTICVELGFRVSGAGTEPRIEIAFVCDTKPAAGGARLIVAHISSRRHAVSSAGEEAATGRKHC